MSAPLSGAYDREDVFAGVPCLIGAQDIEKVIELPLNEQEAETFATCCSQIRGNMAKAAELLAAG